MGKQAKRIINDGDQQIWIKPLEDGSHAVGIFNLGAEDRSMTVKWSDLGLPGSPLVRDIWRQKDLGIKQGSYEVKVPAHGVLLLSVK